METILYAEVFNLFGVIITENNIRKTSRRLKKIKDVRNKIKDLVKAMNSCSGENEYRALFSLMDELKKRTLVLRSAEHSRKRRWRRKQLQHCFFKNLFKAGKNGITPKVKSKPKIPKSVLNEYNWKVVSDSDRTVLLGELDGLDDIAMNIGKFNSEKFKISELSWVVKKKKNVSQLGLNQIPCKVYKKFPRLMSYIYRT